MNLPLGVGVLVPASQSEERSAQHQPYSKVEISTVQSTRIAIMTIIEAVKSAVSLDDSSPARKDSRCIQLTELTRTAATREQMSEARLPLAYRDSCANLLIPLNRCRYEEYYLPWKCEVRRVLPECAMRVELMDCRS